MKAKRMVNRTIDKLRKSMQLDVTKVIDEIALETDERKQLKNLEFVFRVCIPLYFLSDVSQGQECDSEMDAIKRLLLSAHY